MLPPAFVRRGRPLIWAHRGASAEAPENTLAAFALAEAQGADGCELDVQLCSSGEVVVLHDESLARTTGYVGLLAETPWSTVRTLDAGARKHERFRGQRVPLLSEVLAHTARLVNIELKCERADDRGLAAAAVRVVREAKADERVLLSSFNPLCLLRARSLAPHLPRALLFDGDSSFALRHALLAPLVGACALHPAAALATRARMRLWRGLGYSVAAWTVDDVERARALVLRGAGGLITNTPAALLAALAA